MASEEELYAHLGMEQAPILEPLFDRLVVKELAPDQMRKSGLVVPIDVRRDHIPPMEGIVIAVGPGLDWWKQHDIEMPVEVGNHVVFPPQAGVYIELNEERLLVLRVGELLGRIK